MKRILILLFYILILILLAASSVEAVSVQPLNIKITAKPGDTVQFKFNVKAKDGIPETINFYLAQPLQKTNGAFEFKQAEVQSFPESKWINFEVTSLALLSGQEKEVTGTVKVPLDARGFHIASVIVEQPSSKRGPVKLSVCYAVQLEIMIDAAEPRETVDIIGFELAKGENGEPYLLVKAKNTSQVRYGTDATVIVRNSTTKKLIERVQLKPDYYRKNGMEPLIIPGATLHYFSNLKEVLLPGTYDLQLIFRYGDFKQLLVKKSIEVKAGDYIYPKSKLKIIQINPSNILFSARSGGTVVKGIKFENKSAQQVKVVIKQRVQDLKYPYSIFKNTVISFKNGQEFIIGPGRTSIAIVTVQFPKDAVSQGNYGQLNVSVLSTDGKQDPIEETIVNLEAVTLGQLSKMATVTDISAVRDEKKVFVSMIIKNTGNIKINPRATLSLKNDKGDLIAEVIQLSASESDNSVLPMQCITLTGLTNDSLLPGVYKAEVKIISEDQEIRNSTFDIQIK